MARVTFVDCIQSVWGAIDSAKEGKEKGYRLVIRNGVAHAGSNCHIIWHAAAGYYQASQ